VLRLVTVFSYLYSAFIERCRCLRKLIQIASGHAFCIVFFVGRELTDSNLPTAVWDFRIKINTPISETLCYNNATVYLKGTQINCLLHVIQSNSFALSWTLPSLQPHL
jgi:hypothetical protein